MSINPDQFKEHLYLRKKLGGLIAENRRLFPLPEGMVGSTGSIFGNTHPDGGVPATDLAGRNARLQKKIDSTTISNSTHTPGG